MGQDGSRKRGGGWGGVADWRLQSGVADCDPQPGGGQATPKRVGRLVTPQQDRHHCIAISQFDSRRQKSAAWRRCALPRRVRKMPSTWLVQRRSSKSWPLSVMR
eukprot:244951-Chlamydomonas_euryale.AAC.1